MFFEKAGKVAIGTRLRMLSEVLLEDAKEIYKMYDVPLKPKWFPVFYTLSKSDGKSITEIAKEIRHSHPSVSKMVKEMVKAGVVKEGKDKSDGRKNILELTTKGKEIAIKIEDQYLDINNAVEDTLATTMHDIWKAMEELEFLLDKKSMLFRVRDQKKIRESKKVEIIPYSRKYSKVFRALNVEWIQKHFIMEESDFKALDHPQKYIINPGGAILVALYEGEPLGVCALIKSKNEHYDFELVKMGVSPKAQGKGIGYLLGKAAIEKAKELGAKKIFLESNTVLAPAINLYYKLGFQKISGMPTPYERCNIQMELEL